MADRIRVTSVIPGSLPRGERLVSPVGGRRLARFGHLDRGAQINRRFLLRSDTPPLVALADVADAPKTVTRTQHGVSGCRVKRSGCLALCQADISVTRSTTLP